MRKVRKIIDGYEFEFCFWEGSLGLPYLRVLLITKEERRKYPWSNEKIIVEKETHIRDGWSYSRVERAKEIAKAYIAALKEREQDNKNVERFCSEDGVYESS